MKLYEKLIRCEGPLKHIMEALILENVWRLQCSRAKKWQEGTHVSEQPCFCSCSNLCCGRERLMGQMETVTRWKWVAVSQKILSDTPKCSFSPSRTKLCSFTEVFQYVLIHQDIDQKGIMRWIFWKVLVVIDMVFMPILCAQLSLQRFLLQFGDITWNWVYCSLELHANKIKVYKKPNA